MDKIFDGLKDKVNYWLVHEIPYIVILVLGLVLVYKLLVFFIKRIKKQFLKRLEKKPQDTSEKEQRVATLFNVLVYVVAIIFWTIGIVMTLKEFGLDVSPLLASAGILGVALGFGAQAIVGDFLAGFFILLENQISLGDIAKINGTSGEVIKLELRCTTLRDFSGNVHIFQNGKITSMVNMTKEWSAMLFDIEVAYKEDLDNVIKVMKEVADELYKDKYYSTIIIEKPRIFGVDELGSSGIIIKARIKTKPLKQWEIGREYRKRLKMVFDEKGIEIPFPQTVLHWADKENAKNL